MYSRSPSSPSEKIAAPRGELRRSPALRQRLAPHRAPHPGRSPRGSEPRPLHRSSSADRCPLDGSPARQSRGSAHVRDVAMIHCFHRAVLQSTATEPDQRRTHLVPAWDCGAPPAPRGPRRAAGTARAPGPCPGGTARGPRRGGAAPGTPRARPGARSTPAAGTPRAPCPARRTSPAAARGRTTKQSCPAIISHRRRRGRGAARRADTGVTRRGPTCRCVADRPPPCVSPDDRCATRPSRSVGGRSRTRQVVGARPYPRGCDHPASPRDAAAAPAGPRVAAGEPALGRPGGSGACSASSRYHPTRTASWTSPRRWSWRSPPILSAQSTDERVNMVTPALFARYPTALDYATADRAELEEMIHSTGFFRNKANSLIGLGTARGRAARRRAAAHARASWSRCPASAARPRT